MENVELIILPDAESDLAEIRRWYESREVGLGEEFLEEVDRCFERISNQPDAFQRVHEEFRRAAVNRFPYVIFYESAATRIEIYCCGAYVTAPFLLAAALEMTAN